MWTHLNEVAIPAILSTAVGLDAGETMMCGLPLFHANATMATGAFPCHDRHE